VCLLGIALSGLAGRSKERELSSEQKAATIREFDFGKGMLVATFCGVMSSCFAYGLAAGKPLADLTRARLLDHGRADLWQNLPVLIVVLLGGFTTNVVWCVILNARNRSAGEYLAVPGAPRLLLLNYVLSAVAGVVWYLQFFFYSMGQTRMGSYEFSSWTMHMASIIIFSTLWGVALHEWKGTSRKTHGLIASGLAVLVASTILVGYGNFLKGGVVLAQGASAEEGRVTVTWDKVIRVSNTTPTGRRQPAPSARFVDSRSGVSDASRAWVRLRALRAVAAVSEACGRRARAAIGRQDLVGFLAHRSDDRGLHGGDPWSLGDAELQHDPAVDVQDRQAGFISGRP
jgi:L-rhamnose-proton symport protein (RhaT)